MEREAAGGKEREKDDENERIERERVVDEVEGGLAVSRLLRRLHLVFMRCTGGYQRRYNPFATGQV